MPGRSLRLALCLAVLGLASCGGERQETTELSVRSILELPRPFVEERPIALVRVERAGGGVVAAYELARDAPQRVRAGEYRLTAYRRASRKGVCSARVRLAPRARVVAALRLPSTGGCVVGVS